MAEPPPPSAPPLLNLDANILLDSDCPPINDQDLSLEHAFDLDLDFDLNFDDLDGFDFEQFDSTAIPPQDISQFPIADSHSPDLNGCFVNCDSEDIPVLISSESGNSAISDAQGDQGVCPYLKSSSEDSGYEGSPDSGFKVSAVVVSSPDSSNIRRSNSLSTPHSRNSEVDQKVNEECVRNTCKSFSKRKKDSSDGTNGGESKTSKHQKSENCIDKNDEEQKRMTRLMRNRESAHLSRQRRKNYVEELENKVRSLHSTITDLNGKISYAMAENASLRQQLSSSGMYPPPPPGMYPPMGAYMVSCSPYLVKPQGSQVPLVPIPRLRPQQPVSATATATATKGKRTDSKKHDRNTKKVASVTFFGLLFFIFLFGGLLPNLNVRFSTLRNNVSDASSFDSREFDDQHRGRVLEVDSQLNRSNEILGISYINGKSHVDSTPQHVKYHTRESQPLSSSEELIHLDNSSEPLVASLYVPRNDKLVKIDGNLIIHSILASERTMASRHALKQNTNEETGVAILRDLASALAIPNAGSNKGRHSHVYKRHTELRRALPSGSADDTLGDKPVGNGKVQQWFREGLAGPMLSSGMCTEVFQFEVSPSSVSGAITVANISSEQSQNATQVNKRKNRRILHGLPLHFSGSNNKVAKEANKSISSSMVVSVLADPREAGDIDGMITAKSLSRILVVVLLDRVKYVTYSCVLPRAGPHLVAA